MLICITWGFCQFLPQAGVESWFSKLFFSENTKLHTSKCLGFVKILFALKFKYITYHLSQLIRVHITNQLIINFSAMVNNKISMSLKTYATIPQYLWFCAFLCLKLCSLLKEFYEGLSAIPPAHRWWRKKKCKIWIQNL